MRTAIRIILALGAAGTLGALILSLIFNGDSEPSIVVASPAQVATVIEDLGPGDTLHMVTVKYKAAVTSKSACPAGSIRHEGWHVFGPDGALVTSRTEARTEEGVLCSVGELQDGELVFVNGTGEEYDRIPDRPERPQVTVETTIAAEIESRALVAAALAEQESTTVELGAEQVVMLQELDGDTRVLRYILPDVNFQVKTETLRMEDGREVLVESTHFEVYEVVDVR